MPPCHICYSDVLYKLFSNFICVYPDKWIDTVIVTSVDGDILPIIKMKAYNSIYITDTADLINGDYINLYLHISSLYSFKR